MNSNNNKIPPSDIKIEESILSGIITSGDSFINISNILNYTDFYNENFGIIYQALQGLDKNNKPINMLTVCDELKKMDKLDAIGGHFAISQLGSNIMPSTHLEYHALIIHELSIKRNIIKICSEVSNLSYNDHIDSQDILTDLNSKIEAIFNFNRSGVRKLSDCLAHMHDELVKNQTKIKKLEGFRTELSSLREYVETWEPGRLIVIAGRPGMGKTAYAIHEAISAANQYKHTLFFSLEMTFSQLTKRIMLMDENIHRHYFSVNNLVESQWEKIDNRISQINDYELWIDDSTYSLTGIKNTCKLMNKKIGIDAVFIDYLQLIEGDRQLVREQQVAQISRSLKLLAKEINAPIFLLAQLNRESEQRKAEGFKPKLSDLRESGAIEQDADIVIFPHRACYYEEYNEKAWLIVAKHRDGKTGNAEIRINESVTKFSDVYGNQENYHERQADF